MYIHFFLNSFIKRVLVSDCGLFLFVYTTNEQYVDLGSWGVSDF